MVSGGPVPELKHVLSRSRQNSTALFQLWIKTQLFHAERLVGSVRVEKSQCRQQWMREEGRSQDCKIMHENKPSGEGEGRPVGYATLGYGRSERIGKGTQPSGIYH